MNAPALSRLTLPPRLDGTAIDRLPSPHAARHGTDPLILDASGVQDIDPVGVALLWLWCRVLLPSRGGGIRLVGLAPTLRHRIRYHPLASLQREEEEDLFADCCGHGGPSTR